MWYLKDTTKEQRKQKRNRFIDTETGGYQRKGDGGMDE